MKIFLDPGHGGMDHGAVYNGVKEKEMNLKVALKTKELLEANGLDVSIIAESREFEKEQYSQDYRYFRGNQ